MWTTLQAPTHLHTKNAKYKEEGEADENDVSYGPQGGQQSLHHQFQSRRSAYHPVIK